MARKLLLTQNPTFKSTAEIPIPGARPVPLELTFKRRGRGELTEWFEGLATRYKDDATLILDIATAWDLEDAFDADNIAELCEIYPGAGEAILNTYLREQTAGKLGNSVK